MWMAASTCDDSEPTGNVLESAAFPGAFLQRKVKCRGGALRDLGLLTCSASVSLRRFQA